MNGTKAVTDVLVPLKLSFFQARPGRWRYRQGVTTDDRGYFFAHFLHSQDAAHDAPDLWKLRQKLWGEVKNVEDALGFLNLVGLPWKGEESGRPWRTRETYFFAAQDVLWVRQFTRLAVVTPLSQWEEACELEGLPEELAGDAHTLGELALSTVGGLVWITYSLRRALLATVLIDALRQSKWRVCQHPTCGQAFEITDRRAKKKKCCCEAHQQALKQRRYRARQKAQRSNKSRKRGKKR